MGPEVFREVAGFGKEAAVKKTILLSLVLFLGAAGCGYTTHAYVSKTGYKRIYIAPFANKVDTTSEFSEGRKFKTYYPLLENKITNAVVDRYIFDGSLKVSKEEEADLILRGMLVNYRRDSLRNSTADTPEEYRITIIVNITLVEVSTKKVIWEKPGFSGESTYFTTGQFTKSESQALEDACKDLARRIVELTVEAW
jgi:hypothetical protein